jgi:hypothetical protein
VKGVETVAERVDRMEMGYRDALAGLVAKGCAKVGEVAIAGC